MSASRPKPMTGLCGRSAAQKYKEYSVNANFHRHSFLNWRAFNIWLGRTSLKNGFFFLFCARLSLSLDKIGCGSAEQA